MKTTRLLATACIAALFAASAHAALAFLVSQRMGTSVTGMGVIICTYQYGNQKFDKAFPIGNVCPTSIEIQ